jgi:hypothetical protein
MCRGWALDCGPAQATGKAIRCRLDDGYRDLSARPSLGSIGGVVSGMNRLRH